MKRSHVLLLSVMAMSVPAVESAARPPAQPQTPASSPLGLTVGRTETSCDFTTILPPASISPVSVQLEELDATGTPIASRWQMHDDGQPPDLQAGDWVYSLSLRLLPGQQPAIRRFRAVVRTSDGQMLTSSHYDLPTLPFPCGFVTPDARHIVRDPGTMEEFFDNQILMIVDAQATLADLLSAVASIPGARVVGAEPAIRCYQIEIPPAGPAGVRAAMARAAAAAHVVSAEPNGIASVGVP